MTVTSLATGGPTAPSAHDAATARRIARVVRWAVLTGLGLLVLSATREISHADDLTSSGTFGAFLRVSVPIGLVGLGTIFAERSGVVNIGTEGMLILGTWFGAFAGWKYGPWQAVALGIAAGALAGLLHALATVTFAVNQIVSGVAINILAAGVARYLSVVTFTPGTGGGASQSPAVPRTVPNVSVPWLANWLKTIEDKHTFLASDLAGVLRGFTANVSLLTVLAVAMVPFTAWVLWRTVFGLRLRSCGENPSAAETLGVNVYRMRYIGVTVSGALAGFGGAYLVLEGGRTYREGQTGGRGFIGIAAMIFGNWKPAGVAAGAGLFGFADALQLRNEKAVHAVLLAAAIGLLLLAAWTLVRAARRHGPTTAPGATAGVQLPIVQAMSPDGPALKPAPRLSGPYARAAAFAVTGTLLWILYATTNSVAGQFVQILPHVTTLLVLGFASQRLRPPRAAGLPYRKGEAR